MRTIVITDVTSNKAIVIARFIKATYPDIRVITCDHRPITKILRTKYSDAHFILSNPAQHPDAYINELANLVRETNAQMLIPVNSKEIRLLIAHKDKFGTALSYYGDPEIFTLLDSKDKLADLAARLGIKTPKVYASVNDVDGPVVVKPVNLSGSKGVNYYQGRADVKTAPGLMIQQRVDGAGVGYSVFVRDGKIMAGHGHIRLAETPSTGGSSTYRGEFFVEDMRKTAETLMEHTKWSGFAMIEFKWTGRDLYLIEINPRIWGSVYQGLINGTNYFESLLGPARIEKPAHPIATYFSPLFYFSLIGYLRRGDFTPLKTFLNNCRHNVADVSFLRDPLGYFSMAAR